MKIVLAPLILFLLLGCGILEMLFPIEWQQRYIDRKVESSELLGTWVLTSDSETRIKAYLEQNDFSWGYIDAPWKTITLRRDSSCQVELELSWDPENSVLTESDALPTCTWKVDNILGHDTDGSFKDVQGLFVRFEHYEQQTDSYLVYYSESYIVEENNELILWNFIGDPTYFDYQDFKRISE